MFVARSAHGHLPLMKVSLYKFVLEFHESWMNGMLKLDNFPNQIFLKGIKGICVLLILSTYSLILILRAFS